jgi:hypothetical protein
MLFQTSESTNNTKESGKNSGYRRGDISAPVFYMKIIRIISLQVIAILKILPNQLKYMILMEIKLKR